MGIDFRPGDQVQELRGQEKGVVVALLPGGKVLVRTEGWGEMDYLAQELVLTERKSESHVSVSLGAIDQSTLQENALEPGLWLGYRQIAGEDACELRVQNTTGIPVFFFFQVQPGSTEGRAPFKEIIGHGQEVRLISFVPPVTGVGLIWHFQIVYLTSGKENPRYPLVLEKRFRPRDFNKVKPATEGGMVWFTCLKEVEEAGLVPDPSVTEKTSAFTRPEQVVDLHEHKILDSATLGIMHEGDILREQLKVFSRNLDQAIAAGMESIIFIHGLGKGILKQAILVNLENHPYSVPLRAEPAPEARYGAGALIIYIG